MIYFLQELGQTISSDILLNPLSYLPLFIVLSLELVIPACKTQKVFSVGLGQDFAWFLTNAVVEIIILFPYASLLRSYLEEHLFYLKIDIINKLPAYAVVLAGIVVFDLTLYLNHVLMHKVEIFWYFHSVHHSQKNLNYFTDDRFHIVDNLMMYTATTFTMFLLQVSIPTSISFWFFRKWYLRFYHSNIKLNFGFLKYIFVTPQSHRIHHSVEEEHFDKNFGNLFSIWDYCFKTQYLGPNVYPNTGVDDYSFPVEHNLKPIRLLYNCWIQMAYPFKKVILKFAK